MNATEAAVPAPSAGRVPGRLQTVIVLAVTLAVIAAAWARASEI